MSDETHAPDETSTAPAAVALTTHSCRWCDYVGAMPGRVCPSCDRGMPGRLPGSTNAEHKPEPERVGYAKLGEVQAKVLADLELWSGLDGSKLIRLALHRLHNAAEFDGTNAEAFERMFVVNEDDESGRRLWASCMEPS